MRSSVRSPVVAIGVCALSLMAMDARAVQAEDVFSVSAHEINEIHHYQEAQGIFDALEFADDCSFSLKLADASALGGDADSGSAVHMYVKAADTNDMDAIAAQLNGIEPSVGVEMTLPF